MNNDNDDYIFNVLSNTAALPGMKAENVFFSLLTRPVSARSRFRSVRTSFFLALLGSSPTMDRRVKSVWFGKLLTGTV